MLLTPIHLFLSSNHRRLDGRRGQVIVGVVAVDASSKVKRDVVDGGDHGTHEGRAGEEERPAVPISEGNASG